MHVFNTLIMCYNSIASVSAAVLLLHHFCSGLYCTAPQELPGECDGCPAIYHAFSLSMCVCVRI
jgi:hypothetical protein